MSAVAFCEPHEVASVEFHPTIMDIVRLLTWTRAVRAKPDFAFFLINSIHVTDRPVSLRDLVFQCSSRGIKEVKMIPAVSFGHPDNFASGIEVLTREFARVTDES